MNTEIEKLTQILRDSNNIVFFGGAVVVVKVVFQISEVQVVCGTKNLK